MVDQRYGVLRITHNTDKSMYEVFDEIGNRVIVCSNAVYALMEVEKLLAMREWEYQKKKAWRMTHENDDSACDRGDA